jgi:hypothetical protein
VGGGGGGGGGVATPLPHCVGLRWVILQSCLRELVTPGPDWGPLSWSVVGKVPAQWYGCTVRPKAQGVGVGWWGFSAVPVGRLLLLAASLHRAIFQLHSARLAFLQGGVVLASLPAFARPRSFLRRSFGVHPSIILSVGIVRICHRFRTHSPCKVTDTCLFSQAHMFFSRACLTSVWLRAPASHILLAWRQYLFVRVHVGRLMYLAAAAWAGYWVLLVCCCFGSKEAVWALVRVLRSPSSCPWQRLHRAVFVARSLCSPVALHATCLSALAISHPLAPSASLLAESSASCCLICARLISGVTLVHSQHCCLLSPCFNHSSSCAECTFHAAGWTGSAEVDQGFVLGAVGGIFLGRS